MRVIHKQMKDDLPSTFAHCFQYAKEHEQTDDNAEAIRAYEKCIQLQPKNEQSYNRLMILFRKTKQPQKELKIIHQAIAAFEAISKPKKLSRSITTISNALSKATGLIDKKGKPLNEVQPILKWRNREMLLKKRLNNQ